MGCISSWQKSWIIALKGWWIYQHALMEGRQIMNVALIASEALD